MSRRILLAVLAAALLDSVPSFAAKLVGETTSHSSPQQSGGANENKSSSATGTVSQVSCAGGVKIHLDTPEGTRTLRIQSGTPFQITAPTSAQANIDPCTSLKGLRVTVRFIPDDKKGMSGTLQQVQILSPEDPPKAALLADSPSKEVAPKASQTETITSDGIVKAVRCDGKELHITLAVIEGDFKLHARDYTRVDIQEEVAFQSGNYDPCAKLNGHHAIVTYVLVDKKTYDGEIMAIEVGH
ncbi:MAG: hypothetical protein ACRD5M_12865 [Candidatus Acidiferrales bacterium]